MVDGHQTGVHACQARRSGAQPSVPTRPPLPDVAACARGASGPQEPPPEGASSSTFPHWAAAWSQRQQWEEEWELLEEQCKNCSSGAPAPAPPLPRCGCCLPGGLAGDRRTGAVPFTLRIQVPRSWVAVQNMVMKMRAPLSPGLPPPLPPLAGHSLPL